MSTLFNLGLMGLGAVLLFAGTDWFLDGARDLSRLLGLSPLVLGILLIGLEPEEMLTAALASGRGLPELAINNAIGTNVTLVTCALGLSALLAPVVLPRAIRRQALLATLVALVPLAMLLSGLVNRLEGILLLLLFAGYTLLLLRIDRATFAHILSNDEEDNDENIIRKTGHLWRLSGLTLLGLIVLGGGGWLLVAGAERFVENTGLGAGVVGGTLVSLATSAEMISLGLSAARKKQAQVLIGGILGSFAYNLLVTLGLAAVVNPLPVDFRQTLLPLIFLLASHLALLLLIWRGRFGRTAGGLFVLAYIVYLALFFTVR